jgi:homotetrameric cytidine deaminase
MKNAYAPFSNFRVGAAILTTKGQVFAGCNVENSSYGLTNCAERTAIFSAVAKAGPQLEIVAVAVVNDQGEPCSPCGACRQVIYEFGPRAVISTRAKKVQSTISSLNFCRRDSASRDRTERFRIAVSRRRSHRQKARRRRIIRG